MSIFGDALGAAGDVLDAPRSLLYRGGTALARSLGYDGPDVNHFEDLLSNAGMEEGLGRSALGVAGDLATDPLTWLGVGAGARGARAAQRGIARTAAGGAERAAVGEGLAGVGGAGKFKEPLRDTMALRNMEVVPEGAALRPGAVASRAAPGEGRLQADLVRAPDHYGARDVANSMDEMARRGANAEGMAGLEGVYSPTARAYGSAAGAPESALRHERVHAVIDRASRGAGDAAQLPPLMRWPAELRRSSTPWRQDLGIMADELAAQSLEHRTTGGKLAGAANFLINPELNAAYSGIYANAGLDPRLRRLYSSLPGAFVGAGAGAGGGLGGGSGALGRALLGGDE